MGLEHSDAFEQLAIQLLKTKRGKDWRTPRNWRMNIFSFGLQ